MGKVGSFILGGLVGATVALIFAPRSGEETRALVAEKADEYWGKGQTWYNQGKVYVKEGVSGVQPTISKKSDELRQKIDNARTLIAEQVAKNASAARDVINDKVPVAAEKINQAADVVRGRIDSAADLLRPKSDETASQDWTGTQDETGYLAEAETPADQASQVATAQVVEEAAAAEVPDKVEPVETEGA